MSQLRLLCEVELAKRGENAMQYSSTHVSSHVVNTPAWAAGGIMRFANMCTGTLHFNDICVRLCVYIAVLVELFLSLVN